jgi:uroporphyrinogen decarboxylase
MSDTRTSNREWIQRTLAHEETDAVPYNIMLSPPARRLAAAHYGENLEESLALPLRMTGLNSIKPLYADPAEFGDTVADEFGVLWSTNPIDRGAPIGPCLPETDLADYVFPDAAAPYRFSDIAAWCERQEDNYRIVWVGDLWERATFMRGMQPLLEDLCLHPAFVHDLLERLAERILVTIDIVAQRGSWDCIALSDDYGTQYGMLISLQQWRTFLRPQLARIYAAARSHGLAIFHHSCGHVQPLIGDLIDLGLDILHPIQPETMDTVQLKREFGRHLTLCGGFRTQDLLACGSPQQIRTEVRRLKREMGSDGGYILEPGITVQADVPQANLIALLDEARQPGR